MKRTRLFPDMHTTKMMKKKTPNMCWTKGCTGGKSNHLGEANSRRSAGASKPWWAPEKENERS